MSQDTDHPSIHGKTPPLSFRLFHYLERRDWLPTIRADIAHSARSRQTTDWEWIGDQPDPQHVEIHFIALRIPTRLVLTLSDYPKERRFVLSSWSGSEWVAEAMQASWGSDGDDVVVQIRPDRLFLTKKLKLELFGADGLSFRVVPFVAKHVYQDMVYLGRGLQCIEEQRIEEAKGEFRDCFTVDPHHYIASTHLAKLALDDKRWSDAVRWSVHSNVHSRGRFSEQMMWEAFQKQRSPLDQIVPELREESKEWEVGGHYGSICLLNDTNFWLGFGRFHLMQRRQIVDVRRQAAARLLGHLHFDFVDGKEQVAYAGLRVWRNGDNAIEVPIDHLVIIDHADDNPAIRLEGRKRALFHLPELKRGDALELVYALIRVHSERPDGRPDFFILSDLSTQFPTWRSRATIHTPDDWEVRCVTTNGGPAAEEVSETNGYRSHRVEMPRIIYDEWGLTEPERRYRSPHLCCSWGDRDWAEIAKEGSTGFCHKLRDDTLPAHIQDVVDQQETIEDKLRAGFEWIRDNLKYMSLKGNKVRTNDPDLAAKIVADGIGDCMDRSYLVALLCRQLGLDHEYIVTAAESEYVVPDVPSSQFDHILVRTSLNGNRLYLDATSTETPFGWIPRYLQGLPILPLCEAATLETVPEESPDVNHVAITEQLICTPDGSLNGEFQMTASGMPGRWWDSQWKATTMDVDNPLRVARVALNRQMPTAEVSEWDITPYDTMSERFALLGRHSRRPMYAVDGQLFGLIEWRTELFQMYEHKDRAWTGVSIFPLPLHYTISLTITAPDGYMIEGTSESTPFTSGFGDVTRTVSSDQSSLHLQTLLRVKRKFVRSERDEDVLAFLDAWKRALTFAFVLRAAQ
ncbi:MAG: DUF3857 domain-containing protein [candidate division Zixibacteria bacterium]|nr:DUF3857 domain-containing protein [candidate division Zixibacteria bacterium]